MTFVQRSVGDGCDDWLVVNYDKNLTRSVLETRPWEVMTVGFANYLGLPFNSRSLKR